MNKRIEINDRVIVVNPPSILPSLLGAKLRVLSVAKEWVEVEVAKRPILNYS